MLRTGAAHGYCVGLITPASMAGIVAVRSTWRGAVRSTQLGGETRVVLAQGGFGKELAMV